MPIKNRHSTSDLPQCSEPTKRALKVDQTAESFDFELMLAKLKEPAAIARSYAEESFLRNFIFRGLNDLKPAFDSPVIAHFNSADFLEVVDRCTLLGVHIIGIEIFTTAGELLDMEVPEEDFNSWCVPFVQNYQNRVDLSICATYEVQDRVLGGVPDVLYRLEC
jgi:hypothetical protein